MTDRTRRNLWLLHQHLRNGFHYLALTDDGSVGIFGPNDIKRAGACGKVILRRLGIKGEIARFIKGGIARHTHVCQPTNAADFIARLKPWLLKLPKPCGLFAANDDIATVVLDACRAGGLSVPDDIAVIGVDDEPSVCEATKPSLSSVRPNFERAGRLAVDLLVRHLAQPELAEEHILFPVAGVTLRQSTRHLAQPNAKILAALEFIRREATHGLKAADVVAFLGLSERLAETRFKAATGHRITEEITEVRLVRALELLRDPHQALGPIANLCGWNSDIYLKRLFKARYGLTMSQWRKQHSI